MKFRAFFVNKDAGLLPESALRNVTARRNLKWKLRVRIPVFPILFLEDFKQIECVYLGDVEVVIT